RENRQNQANGNGETERHCPTIQIVSVVKKVSKLVQAVLDQLHAAAPKRELVQLSRDDALLPHCSKDDQASFWYYQR
ncbi:hypothetical protein, partial [Rhizobium sp. PEPV16]|uniref:hypothetical protein n=1 Tax=Rhizobium sp. PEPV16 TaxID=1820614 RepID=UPI001AEFA797